MDVDVDTDDDDVRFVFCMLGESDDERNGKLFDCVVVIELSIVSSKCL